MSNKFQKLYPALHWIGWSKNMYKDESINLPYGCHECPFSTDDDTFQNRIDNYICKLNNNQLVSNGSPICNVEQWRSQVRKEVEEIAEHKIKSILKEDKITDAFKAKAKEIANLIEGVSELDVRAFLTKITED